MKRWVLAALASCALSLVAGCYPARHTFVADPPPRVTPPVPPDSCAASGRDTALLAAMRVDPAARLLARESGGVRVDATSAICTAGRGTTSYTQDYRLPPADATEPPYPRYAAALVAMGWSYAGIGWVYGGDATDFCKTVGGNPVTLRLIASDVFTDGAKAVSLILFAGCRPWPSAESDVPKSAGPTWPTAGPRVPVWVRPLGGAVATRPAPVGGMLVVGTATDATDNDVYALDPATGRVRWQARMPGMVWSVGGGSGMTVVRVRPDGGGLDSDLLVGLNSGTGRLRWVTSGVSAGLNGPPYLPERMVLGAGSVFAEDGAGSVAAYALATGALRWRAKVGTSDLLLAAYGDVLYVQPRIHGSASPLALSASTGRVLWRATVAPLYPDGIATDGTRVVACGDSGMYALRASDGHTLWRQKWINCGATVIADGEVITIRATIQALDATTGRTLWQPSATPTVGTPSFGTAAVAGGVVYAPDRLGTTVFAYNLVTGRLLWMMKTPTAGSTQDPLVVGGLLYLSGGHAGVAAFRLP